MSNNLVGPKAEIRFTVEVTRKATGKKEVVEMVGYAMPTDDESATTENKENKNVGDPQHGGS